MGQIVGVSILALVMVVAIFVSIRIAGEYERFAVFVLGRFAGIKGPGLLLRWPGSGAVWTRISVGDSGELLGPDIGRFSDVDLPVAYEGNLRLGTSVRITGFTSDEIKVEADPTKSRRIKCEECGHEMTV